MPAPFRMRLLTARHPHRDARASGALADVQLQLTAAGGGLQRLEERGVNAKAFAELARSHRSAWSLARRYLWKPKDDEASRTAKAAYATLLWEHFLPERPSMEHIDDCLEAGAVAAEAGDPQAAVDHWIRFWNALVSAAPAGSRWQELNGYLMALRVSDWLEAFESELDALTASDPLRAQAAAVLADIRARGPNVSEDAAPLADATTKASQEADRSGKKGEDA